MVTLTISLPEYLHEFVDAEIKVRGPLSRSEFVEQLIVQAYLEKHQEQLEPMLLQGLQGPMTPLTKQDWQDIRERIRDRLAADKKMKRKRA
jgi:metal-responsive CopG/Arc/MetJ family transcriptional regulator